MKKTLLYGLFSIIAVAILASCSKDIGNYDYHEINQITFTDFQSATGYQAKSGEILTIDPKLDMTKDASPDPGNYSYEWSLRLGSSSAPPARDSIISVDKALNIKIGLVAGTYSLQYRVTDKKTGVEFQKRATLTVTTDIYEGYLVLNEVNGQSRLDMLSYKATSNSFEQYTDVLKKVGSTLPMQGQPYQVLCMQYTNANIAAQNYGIFVLTSAGTSRINQETFAYDQKSSIRYMFVGETPLNFAPQRIIGELSLGIYPLLYLFDNNNIYNYSTLASFYAFKYSPLNSYSASGTPFKLSPHIVTNGTAAVMYNLDKRNFVTAASYNSVALADAAPTLNYPVGYDLIYMGKDYNNKAFAVMKDPATAKYWVMRFNIGSAQTSLQQVLIPDFENAKNFVLNPDWGYLFYSIGGKVYEYDLALQQSKLMVDKGSEIITYLDFQRFFKRLAKTNLNYPTWASLLTVASYDPAGTPGSNGTMELYTVPPVNGQLIKTSSWTGFGKIVSVSYRER
ncbi:hypothetical protein FBD94_06510 [Pedobacter hiemivivus]|uniref:PKD-like family protein n=1 Tax=Pedobacter hiemivivus TaxID=2530454 RepID=A0A4U1GKS1_9SPHI|nr:PKD-like family lipoprotein [Pedobacter hiemivivus]TKC63989.1 hypothetical protein FBD94_06510 [Pedobacter hiemivivus]